MSGEISPDFWDLKDASLDKEVAEASLVLEEGPLVLRRGWEAAGRQDTAWAECLLLGRICFHKTPPPLSVTCAEKCVDRELTWSP